MSGRWSSWTTCGATPLPKGRDLAIVTDAGGPAIMATDALPAAGLNLAKLSKATRDRLAKVVPPEASTENPVDMIASADSKRYRQVLEIVLRDEAVHGAIVICVPPVIVDVEATAQAISQVAKSSGKPVLGVFMGADYASKGRTILEQQGIPSYLFPESAVRALGAMAEDTRIRARPLGRPPRFPRNRARARHILAGARAERRQSPKDRGTM